MRGMDWEEHRQWCIDVMGYDPGPLSEPETRKVRKESRSLRTTLSADELDKNGVPVRDIEEGESLEVRQFPTPWGLFLPWEDFVQDEHKRDKK